MTGGSYGAAGKPRANRPSPHRAVARAATAGGFARDARDHAPVAAAAPIGIIRAPSLTVARRAAVNPLRRAAPRALRPRQEIPVFFERLPEFVANHVILVGILAMLIVALVSTEVARLTRKYKALSPAQLTHLINREGALVVDVSALNDFQAGHIPGARHVAMSQFDPENKELAKARELPVAVYDKMGTTSAQAAERLAKAGFTRVYWLEGGLSAWQGADLPLARGKS